VKQRDCGERSAGRGGNPAIRGEEEHRGLLLWRWQYRGWIKGPQELADKTQEAANHKHF